MGKGYFGSCLHMWEEGSIYCTLSLSRDMVTKCPQNRQSPQKGTSVRDMGLKTPKCIIMNGALKCNPRFRSLSLCPGSWKSFWCFWRHWSLTVCLCGVWMYVFSWSPTVHVCGLQRKASKNCAFFSHMGRLWNTLISGFLYIVFQGTQTSQVNGTLSTVH